jgi:hypothetical protein
MADESIPDQLSDYLSRIGRKGGICTRQSSHPGTAKSQRYQGIESRGKEAVAGSEEEKEAEEVDITLSR